MSWFEEHLFAILGIALIIWIIIVKKREIRYFKKQARKK